MSNPAPPDPIRAALNAAARVLRALPDVQFSDSGPMLAPIAGPSVWSLHELADAMARGDLPLRVCEAAVERAAQEAPHG